VVVGGRGVRGLENRREGDEGRGTKENDRVDERKKKD
jgi:hypothetical protein